MQALSLPPLTKVLSGRYDATDMKSPVAISSLLCCTVLAFQAISAASAGNRKVKAPKESRRLATHAIETLEEQWRTAVLGGDSVLMDKLLSDDFLGISARGTLSDKQQYLQYIATHATQFSTFNVMDMKVRVQPASAVAVSQAHVTGQLEGTPIEGTFRYTKVYARIGLGWKITNFEATRMSTPLSQEKEMNSGIPLTSRGLPHETR